MPRAKTLSQRPVISAQVPLQFSELHHACIGFYWRIKSEIDLRHLLRDVMSLGAEAALPVVVEKGWPLECWQWQPRIKLARGLWNIRLSAERYGRLPCWCRWSASTAPATAPAMAAAVTTAPWRGSIPAR